MNIKDEIKKLEENHSQRVEIVADGDCFDTADIWDDFEKALKIINNLMEVVEMQNNFNEKAMKAYLHEDCESLVNALVEANFALKELLEGE